MPDDHALWRDNFVGALQLLGLAAARLPFGVPDPILCGASAVALYTGDLWPVDELQVIAADARLLTVELFAVGFAGLSVHYIWAEVCGIPSCKSVLM
jgi:hypothetical protein